MTCERIREQIPECLAGRLDKAARENLIEHLESCSGCRAELADLGIVWRSLENMNAPEPGRAMRTRFMETLEAYKAGLEQAPPRRTKAAPWQTGKAAGEPASKGWFAWWPSQPAWQAAIACSLLIAGIFGGRYLAMPHGPSPEMAQLKGQVEGLRQLVALSLLQEQSPSDRLRGITFSSQITQPDTQVEQALLHTLNHDGNINVRLSVVDALEKYGNKPDVQRALVDSVPLQESPLVQIALIDLLVQLNDRDSSPVLRKLAQDGQVDESVRQRATLAVQRLGGR